MSDIPPLMNSEDFNFLLAEVDPDGLLVNAESQSIPDAYDTVPSNESFSGVFNFDVGIPASKNLVYSPKLQKLFIRISSDFTVQFTWDFKYLSNLFVRAKPRFSTHEHANKPVKRCLQHAHAEDPSNKDGNGAIRHHVLRCKNTQANYDGGFDQHFSVCVPLSLPEAGTDFVPHTYQFVCQNSCSSGMNRRPIEVIFTLEDGCGEVHGRKSINVRICSCPKRDRQKEEIELGDSPAGQPPPGKRRMTVKRPHPDPIEDEENDSSVHTVTIKVIGAQNKKAVLRYAFNLLAGEMLLQPDREHLYTPVLNELRNTFKNS